jgi:type IV secretory pathway VirB10-like protein
VIKLKQINLSVFLIGAGIVHLVGLAVLLPMLITLPGPGGDIEPKAVVVDVDLVPASPSSPKVEPEVDQTSALPAAPQTPGTPASAEPVQAPAPGESAAQPEPKDAAPPTLANVSPESALSTEERAVDAAPLKEKAKFEGKGGKPGKLTRTAPKKRSFSNAKGKSAAGRPARSGASSQPPYKGPFSALFNAPPGATGKKRK